MPPLHVQVTQLTEHGDVDGLLELLRGHPKARASAGARASIARSLGDIGRPEATPALVRLLFEDGERDAARLAAAVALGKTGGPAAVEALSRAVRRSERDVACWAARSLGIIGEGAGLPALLDAAVRPEAVVRAFATEALGKLAWSAEARDALLAALDDPSSEVRTGAASAMADLGDQSLLPALEAAARRESRFGLTRGYLRMKARYLRAGVRPSPRPGER